LGQIALGNGLNLEKAVKWSKFTPPSPIKVPPLNQLAIAILLAISKLLAIRTLLVQQHLATWQSFTNQ
jgi:hypothetical protein